MILTIFYAGATLMQTWRLRSLSLRIANRLCDQYSISFYRTCIENADGFVAINASSDACENSKNGRVVETLWYHSMLRGVSILPQQRLGVNKWITFSNLPAHLNPLYSAASTIDLDAQRDADTVFVLLETSIWPDLDAIQSGAAIVYAEQYGVPYAWKIDKTLAIVLKSNANLVTELIHSSFMQNRLFINNYLPIIRVGTVEVHGKPLQLLELDSTPVRELNKNRPNDQQLFESSCRYHIDKLKILNLVANLRSEPSPDDYTKDMSVLTGSAAAAAPNGDCVTSADEGIENTAESIPVTPVEEAVDQVRSLPPLSNGGLMNGACKTDTGPSELIHIEPTPLERSPTPREQSPTPADHSGQPRNNSGWAPLAEPPKTPAPPAASKRDSVHSARTKSIDNGTESVGSAADDHLSSKYSTLSRKKRNSDGAKPPNVLVYSESNDSRANIMATVKRLLHPDRYTVYELKTEQLKTSYWFDSTTLLIVCGPASPQVGAILMEYFLCGGKMLCLCSDVLNMVLPIYRTAEVRESELVHFSYGRWHKIQLMHHIFCYHPSPIKKHFSLETDERFDAPAAAAAAQPLLTCPGSIDFKDLRGDIHRLVVKVLGSEETWNTPSLILATDTCCAGLALFSQVHLDADPNCYEHDDYKYAALMKSDVARLEILADLLSTQLGLITDSRGGHPSSMFPNAFFLGRHEGKFELLEKLKPHFIATNTLRTNTLTIKFHADKDVSKANLENTLTVLLHSCPEDFSTIRYFDTLKTDSIGRLAIYAPVINSTMTLVSNLNMRHGLAVITRKQTAGVGRNKNQWLSPEGCALFSLQLHIPLSSPLGQRIPLLQHLISVAIVHSITNRDEYKRLDIRLKWPNDMYANGTTKIGGVVVNTELNGPTAICNVGVGFNLDNSIPTTCVNDMITSTNLKNGTNVPRLEYECFFARVFNEIERLIERVQAGDSQYFTDLYYTLWLHSNAEIVIIDADGNKKLATIVGIDDFGYLKVQQPNREPETVHPDGNTFDILRGLISAKHY